MVKEQTINKADKKKVYDKRTVQRKVADFEGYNLESFTISASMIEDRLKSFFYHIGYSKSLNEKTLWEKSRCFFEEAFSFYQIKNDTKIKFPTIKTFSLSIQTLDYLVFYLGSFDKIDGPYNSYFIGLKQRLFKNGEDYLRVLIKDLNNFRLDRNLTVHSMFDAEIDDHKIAAEGKRLSAEIDLLVKWCKRKYDFRQLLELIHNSEN